jgi:hypothetical protein
MLRSCYLGVSKRPTLDFDIFVAYYAPFISKSGWRPPRSPAPLRNDPVWGPTGATVDGVAPDRDRLDPDAEGVEPAPAEGQQPGPDDELTVGDDANLAGDDTGEAPDVGDHPRDGSNAAAPSKVETWRKRSAAGAVMTGIAMGLQQVFEKEREEPAIIMTTSGDPPRDLPVEAEVEHGRPRRSVVNIRPWLLDRRPAGRGLKDRAAPAGADSDPASDAPGDAPGGGRPDPAAGTSPEGD